MKILMDPKLKKKSTEGYAEGKMLLVERLNARAYMDAEDDKSKELLALCNEIFIDHNDIEITNHPATTEEIRQCCADVKVSFTVFILLISNMKKCEKDWLLNRRMLAR